MSYMSFEYRFLLVYLGARFRFNNPDSYAYPPQEKKKKDSILSPLSSCDTPSGFTTLQFDYHSQPARKHVTVRGRTNSDRDFIFQFRCTLFQVIIEDM